MPNMTLWKWSWQTSGCCHGDIASLIAAQANSLYSLYFMTEKAYSVFLLKIRHVFLECSHNAVLYSGHIIQTLWYGSWPLNQRIHAIHVRFWLKRPVHGAATASYCQLNTVLFLGCMTSLLGAFDAVKSDISIACALIRKLRGKLERPLNLQED